MPSLILWEDADKVEQVASTAKPFPVTVVGGGGGVSSDVNLLTIAGTPASVNNGTADAGTLRVTIASDTTAVLTVNQGTSPWIVSGTVTANQGGSWTVAATQSGTWTVQPGNTANTTAWLVTGTGGTFPVTDSGGSLTVDNGGTFAVQAAQSGTWNIGTVTTVTTVSTITNVVHVDDNGGSITVDGTVTATIAAGATTIAKAEDSASADADVGVGMLAVRKATPANTSGTDGDYEFLQMSAGRLWVDPSGVTLTVASHAVTNAGTFAVQAAQSGTWTVQPGNTANTTAWLVTGTGGTFPVTDSGGSLTVDNGGTFAVQAAQSGTWTVQPGNTANTTAWLVTGTGGTFPVTDSGGSLTVDNGGTFAVQAAQSGTWNIGTVSTVTAVTAITNALPAGTNIIGGAISAPSSSSSFAPTRAVTTALAASLVLKSSAGNLYSLTGYSSRTSSQFIQIHNTTSLPADTAVPIYTFIVAPQTNFSLDFNLLPEAFSTGITVCNSSTAATKTIGSADCWFVGRVA